MRRANLSQPHDGDGSICNLSLAKSVSSLKGRAKFKLDASLRNGAVSAISARNTRLRFLSIASMQKQPIAIVLGVPLLAILGTVLFGNPLFEGNDDTGLAMVGAGFGLAVEPDAHLLFAHYGYGLLLGAISRLVGAVAHGWISLAALALSIGLYTRALCEWRGNVALPACALAIAAGVFAQALLEVQFTITSSLLFGAAIGCSLAVQQAETRSLPLTAAIYAAIVLSFLIRPSAAALGCVIVGPALCWLAWHGRRPALHLIVAIAAIALAAYLTDRAAYALSHEWREAMEYNQLRGLFNDFFRIPWIPGAAEYSKVGWSANDHAMFMSWYALHPIFDYENIKFLAQTLALQAPLLVFSGITGWLAEPWHSPVLAALLSVQMLLCLLLPSQQRAVAALLLVGTLVAIILAALTGRPPLFRILFSAIGIALLCTLCLLPGAQVRLRLFQQIGLGIAVAAGIFAGSTAIEAHARRVAEAEAYRAKLAEAAPWFSGTVISWGASLMWELLVTPVTVHAPVRGLTIPSIGLFAKMPVTRSTLQKLGITDLGATLCAQPDVRLIAHTSLVTLLQGFCEQHYHVRPVYNLVFDYSRTQIFVSAAPERKE